MDPYLRKMTKCIKLPTECKKIDMNAEPGVVDLLFLMTFLVVEFRIFEKWYAVCLQ